MDREALKSMLLSASGKAFEACSDKEIYEALLVTVKQLAKEKERIAGEKKLYYISAEFLIGKLLSNNLINLGIYEDIREILKEAEKDLEHIEDAEPEPSLGNGGLGRLAACFLDSIATLGLPGDGIGLNYHLGLFKQGFSNFKQTEEKNPWIEEEGWLTLTEEQFTIPYKNFELQSRMYDIDVIGYEQGVNKLHLFDLAGVDEAVVKDGISFDKEDISRNLTLFLYPDDSDCAGNLLRIYQQYFMVSSGAQLILKEYEKTGYKWEELAEHVVIQINDTHPSLVIPELIRLLTGKGLSFEKSVDVVRHACAYTNHTILSEALETWPISYLEEVVPALMPIIRKLDEAAKEGSRNPETHIIDSQNRVHMAYMDIHYGFSVNGVAALHTAILKQSELKAFYELYPEKFQNKTNGITFRRWLLHCNPELVQWISKYVEEDFKKDANKLEKLLRYQDSEIALETLLQVKQQKKAELKSYFKETYGVEVSENSIYDIQIKRLHEYKRQQMNALYIIYKYLEIKKGNLPPRPITMIFGAKAAPAYTIAKDIIHLLLCLQELINNDPEAAPHLKVIMTENYNVTLAQKLIPACDISEQISLASKEASGTGNMKFMLNGAVTIGTMDGANVEIHDLVGEENIYIFGESSDQVIAHYKNQDYRAVEYYLEDEEIRALVDYIISPNLLRMGDPYMLLRLHAELIQKDWFMTLLDLKAYIEVKEKVYQDYEDRRAWSRKMLVNIAKAGYFSSDRTIAEYNRDIWKLK